jgi:hypothetical protein
MDRDKKSNLYKEPSIDAFYQVLSRFVKQTWPPQTILVSDWLISKKSSPLKPLCQMQQNLVGSIYGRGEESKKSANQKEESPVAAMFVNGSGRNEQSL